MASVIVGRTQREVAEAIGMAPDAFSRALHGQRNFSAWELAGLAELTGADLRHLVTGEEDPHRLVVSARHTFDPQTGGRSVPGADEDQGVLGAIRHLYRQAEGEFAPTEELPRGAGTMRVTLGSGFVPELRSRLEVVGVDVVCVPELSTAYSFRLDGRCVIAIGGTGNWFHQNFGVAHELGHLASGDEGVLPGHPGQREAEERANAFAAELLMPESVMRRFNWLTVSPAQLADLLWELGVSTKALSVRLKALHLPVGEGVDDLLRLQTQTLLRRHWTRVQLFGVTEPDLITERMEGAARRSFPAWLLAAHGRMVAEGRIGKGSLAWMLGVEPALLDVAEPATEGGAEQAVADLLTGSDID